MTTAPRTWPCAATTCHRDLRDHELDGRQTICSPCVSTLHSWLHEIPLQLIVLGGSRQRETTGAAGRAGTRTPPLPGRDDVLNLLGPAAWTSVRDTDGDQTGAAPIVGVLGSWVRIVCEERRWNGPAAPTAETLALWLGRGEVLNWSARQPWAGELRDEIHGLMRAIWGVTRLRPQRRPVPQPCPRCDSLALVETDHEAYIDCTTCEARFTRGELALGAVIAVAQLDVA